MNSWRVDTALAELPGLAAKEVAVLESAGYRRVGELLEHFPKRYEDRRLYDRFPSTGGGGALCLKGTILDVRTRNAGGKRRFTEAVVVSGGDDIFGGRVTCRWFNMPYIRNVLAAGQELVVYGKPKEYRGAVYIDHPEYELVDEFGSGIHVERVVPIYKNVSGISQRRLREILWAVLEGLEDESLEADFPVDPSYPRNEAKREIHFPPSLETAEAARRYFALEEFFQLQLQVAWRRARYREQAGRVTAGKATLLRAFYESMPFDLTGAQKRSVREVFEDMKSSRPMNRLLQGDVGAGKTFVALCAALLAVDGGVQVALMAPTQILAEQHYLTFRKWLEPLGVRVQLKTGSRDESTALELEGKPQVIIGTHALLYEGAEFDDLGLVIVDEQHKFGVEQRGRLMRRGVAPDLLVMTATPIPRTLTLSIYGDLDVSVLDEYPAGRGKIVTGVRKDPQVTKVREFIKGELERGRQAYLVYPLVEESDKTQAKAAVKAHEEWSKRLKGYEVGLLHGKMAPEEKDAVMERFRDNETQVLIATTVVEVGVDVPNANVMVIHDAERFGLAQLHQLRGRIGRGEHKSYCVLLTSDASEEGMEKLKVLERTRDGFVIAEEDLRLRGPGEVLGTAQSGVGELRFLEFFADTDLLRQARAMAAELIERDPGLVGYPGLRAKAEELGEEQAPA